MGQWRLLHMPSPLNMQPSPVNASDTDLAQFQQWLNAGLLPMIQPSQQARSVKTAWHLLSAGAAMMHENNFDTLSVEDICAKAGTTVGGFYGRFQNKDAFFLALQKLVLLRSEESMNTLWRQPAYETQSLQEVCMLLVASAVQRYRQHQGVFRTSLQRAHEGMWDAFKDIGDQTRALLTAALATHLQHIPAEQRKLRVEFGHQAMISVLCHAVQNAPSPVHLSDDAMVHELTSMLVAYLEQAPSVEIQRSDMDS